VSSTIPTLREYGEYLESLDRPRDIDALLMADLDAPEPTAGEATVVDLDAARGARAGRRRWLVVAAAAAVAAAMVVTVLVRDGGDDGIRTRVPAGRDRSVTTLPPPPASALAHPGFAALMLTEGVAPSSPKTGELIASAWLGGDLGVYYLYADGRLIRLDDFAGTPHWVEQRLTPEAAERVRSEFLATGLFAPGPGPRKDSDSCGSLASKLCVRDGDHFLNRSVVVASPEEQQLVDRLRALPSLLPPTDWADQQARAYVPAKYAVCFAAAGPRGPLTVGPDPAEVLRALPARAAKLLGGRRAEPRDDEFFTGSDCFDVSTAKARSLGLELVNDFGPLEPGIKYDGYSFAIAVDVNRPRLKRFSVGFNQLLPDGEFAFYYPALAKPRGAAAPTRAPSNG
jgi:hypothetical protein